MVSFQPDKTDLAPGYSGPRHIFENMGLKEGDIFENKRGITLIIQPTTNEDKLRVQAMEETELEKTTEDILKNDFGLEVNKHFVKQYYPPQTNKSYSIDFAFPLIRLAIEPHGSHLWGMDSTNEEQKQRDLNSKGWDVLWLDENDLENHNETVNTIQEYFSEILDGLQYSEGLITKSLPDTRNLFTYQHEKTVEQAGLKIEEGGTVVYDGKVIPYTIADLLDDRGR